MSELQQLRKGSTPLLILSILATERKYGFQIMRELEEQSEGYFTMTAALLYPTLHQLETDGLVESQWEAASDAHTRKRKYYAITLAGREALAKSQAEWRNFVDHLFKMIEGKVQSHQER